MRRKRSYRVKRYFKRATKTASPIMDNPLVKKIIPLGTAFLYGMYRNKIGQKIINIPMGPLDKLGSYKDEAVIVGGVWGAQALGANKIPGVRNILKVIEYNEGARIGQTYSLQKAQTTAPTGTTPGQMIFY